MASCTNPEQLKKDRYVSLGLFLYQQHCTRCHGADGAGLGTLYPPLAKSNYIAENPDSIACIIWNGKNGELWVNGIMYDQPMPANRELLKDEVAQLVNYINNAWGNSAEFYSIEQAEKDLESCN